MPPLWSSCRASVAAYIIGGSCVSATERDGRAGLRRKPLWRRVTTPHPEREGASTVLHRCGVAPEPVRWLRSTRQRWNARLPLLERAPPPRTLVLFPVGTTYHGTGKHYLVGTVHADSIARVVLACGRGGFHLHGFSQ